MRSRHLRTFTKQRILHCTNFPFLLKAYPILDPITELHSLSTYCDAIVTAGPFLPALIIPYLNTKTPLWMDWPKRDPLADGLAKSNVQTRINWTEIYNATHLALARADAFGVISQRSKDALIGELMILGRSDETLYTNAIHVTPIAYEFPETSNILSTSRSPQQKSFDILLCGSINTWFDVQNFLCRTPTIMIQQQKKPYMLRISWEQRILLLHSQGLDYVLSWKNQLIIHISKQEFMCMNGSKIKISKHHTKCHVGIWMDKEGVEPYLGSRTRALFYAWHGLDIIGGGSCELAQDMIKHHNMYVVSSAHELTEMLLHVSKCHLSIEQSQKRHQRLQMTYGLESVFEPLGIWLKCPTTKKTDNRDHIRPKANRTSSTRITCYLFQSNMEINVFSTSKIRLLKKTIQR